MFFLSFSKLLHLWSLYSVLIVLFFKEAQICTYFLWLSLVNSYIIKMLFYSAYIKNHNNVNAKITLFRNILLAFISPYFINVSHFLEDFCKLIIQYVYIWRSTPLCKYWSYLRLPLFCMIIVITIYWSNRPCFGASILIIIAITIY